MLDFLVRDVLGENSLKLPQDSGVAEQVYLFDNNCRAHSQRKDESEAISQTSHRVYIR